MSIMCLSSILKLKTHQPDTCIMNISHYFIPIAINQTPPEDYSVINHLQLTYCIMEIYPPQHELQSLYHWHTGLQQVPILTSGHDIRSK